MENNINILIDKLQKAMVISGGKVKSTGLLKALIKDISKGNQDSKELIQSSFENIAPLFLVKTQKRGKKVIQTPTPVTNREKSFAIASRWLVKNAKKHKLNSLKKGLVLELNDASNNQGFSKKQQQELSKLVILNRAALARK